MTVSPVLHTLMASRAMRLGTGNEHVPSHAVDFLPDLRSSPFMIRTSNDERAIDAEMTTITRRTLIGNTHSSDFNRDDSADRQLPLQIASVIIVGYLKSAL